MTWSGAPDGGADRRRFAISSDVAYAALDDGVVVLNLETKRYYSLNETGAAIWKHIGDGLTAGDIVSQLVATFDVELEAARAAFERLVRELEEERLLTTAPEGSA